MNDTKAPVLTRKFGRKPRSYDPRVPHLSALRLGRAPISLPAQLDNTKNMPQNLGMMLNNQLGDCTCAAFYHARQVWTFNAQKKMVTEPDKDVLGLYEQACGYNPKVPATDQGGNEQHVLTFLLRKGAPTGANGAARDRIMAFVEVDPRNLDDVRRTIYECGLAYIGFNVPQNIMPQGGLPPKVWTVDKANAKIIGGHAVVLPGYDSQGPDVISWGERYKMTWEFFSTYVDEVYAIADHAWFDATKKSPLGMSAAELEAQMEGLKAA